MIAAWTARKACSWPIDLARISVASVVGNSTLSSSTSRSVLALAMLFSILNLFAALTESLEITGISNENLRLGNIDPANGPPRANPFFAGKVKHAFSHILKPFETSHRVTSEDMTTVPIDSLGVSETISWHAACILARFSALFFFWPWRRGAAHATRILDAVQVKTQKAEHKLSLG